MNLRLGELFPPPSRPFWPRPLPSNRIRRRQPSLALSHLPLPLLAFPTLLVRSFLPHLLPLPAPLHPPLFLPLWIWMGPAGSGVHLPMRSVDGGPRLASAPIAATLAMIWPPVRGQPALGRPGVHTPASRVPTPPSPLLWLPLHLPSSKKTISPVSRSLAGRHYSFSPSLSPPLPLSPCP